MQWPQISSVTLHYWIFGAELHKCFYVKDIINDFANMKAYKINVYILT